MSEYYSRTNGDLENPRPLREGEVTDSKGKTFFTMVAPYFAAIIAVGFVGTAFCNLGADPFSGRRRLVLDEEESISLRAILMDEGVREDPNDSDEFSDLKHEIIDGRWEESGGKHFTSTSGVRMWLKTNDGQIEIKAYIEDVWIKIYTGENTKEMYRTFDWMRLHHNNGELLGKEWQLLGDTLGEPSLCEQGETLCYWEHEDDAKGYFYAIIFEESMLKFVRVRTGGEVVDEEGLQTSEDDGEVLYQCGVPEEDIDNVYDPRIFTKWTKSKDEEESDDDHNIIPPAVPASAPGAAPIRPFSTVGGDELSDITEEGELYPLVEVHSESSGGDESISSRNKSSSLGSGSPDDTDESIVKPKPKKKGRRRWIRRGTRNMQKRMARYPRIYKRTESKTSRATEPAAKPRKKSKSSKGRSRSKRSKSSAGKRAGSKSSKSSAGKRRGSKGPPRYKSSSSKK